MPEKLPALPDGLKLWRISKHADLSGAGGKLAFGRWHSQGLPIVYLADSHPGAILESLVHLQYFRRRLPDGYTLLKVRVLDSLESSDVEPLPENWRERSELTQTIGDRWLAEKRSALMRVPSSIVSETWNYLLNPEHPDAELVKIVGVSQERYDQRLFRFGSWRR